MSSIRNIYIKKYQYYISPGDTDGNTSYFSEISPGIIQSIPLNFINITPDPSQDHGSGYIIAASRPYLVVPPDSGWLEDIGNIDETSGRVFFNSSETLFFGQVGSLFKKSYPILGDIILETKTSFRLSHSDWWKSVWVLNDPYSGDSYDCFLGNLLNYIDKNFPASMTNITLIIWMNQVYGETHIPFIYEGIPSTYDTRYKYMTM